MKNVEKSTIMRPNKLSGQCADGTDVKNKSVGGVDGDQ